MGPVRGNIGLKRARVGGGIPFSRSLDWKLKIYLETGPVIDL